MLGGFCSIMCTHAQSEQEIVYIKQYSHKCVKTFMP